MKKVLAMLVTVCLLAGACGAVTVFGDTETVTFNTAFAHSYTRTAFPDSVFAGYLVSRMNSTSWGNYQQGIGVTGENDPGQTKPAWFILNSGGSDYVIKEVELTFIGSYDVLINIAGFSDLEAQQGNDCNYNATYHKNQTIKYDMSKSGQYVTKAFKVSINSNAASEYAYIRVTKLTLEKTSTAGYDLSYDTLTGKAALTAEDMDLSGKHVLVAEYVGNLLVGCSGFTTLGSEFDATGKKVTASNILFYPPIDTANTFKIFIWNTKDGLPFGGLGTIIQQPQS